MGSALLEPLALFLSPFAVYALYLMLARPLSARGRALDARARVDHDADRSRRCGARPARRQRFRAARAGASTFRRMSRTASSFRGVSNERPSAALAGRKAQGSRRLLQARPAGAGARSAQRRGRGDAAGRRRGARPRARRAGASISISRPPRRPTKSCAARGRPASRSCRPAQARHGDPRRRRAADRDDDAARGCRDRRAPRQGGVRPRFRRRRQAARLHHQRAVARRRRNGPRHRRRPRRSRGADGCASSATRMQRIREDYLRILRFFRFSARFAATALDPRGSYGRDPRPRRPGAAFARAGARRIAEAHHGAARRRGRARRWASAAFSSRSSAASPIRAAPPPDRDRGGSQLRADPLLRLAALAVAIPEDADRLRDRLRLANAEHERIRSAAAALDRPARDHGAAVGRRPAGAPVRRRARGGARRARACPGRVRKRRAGRPAFAAADRFLAETPEPKLPFSGADMIARGVAAGRPRRRGAARLPGAVDPGGLSRRSRRRWPGCSRRRRRGQRRLESAIRLIPYGICSRSTRT